MCRLVGGWVLQLLHSLHRLLLLMCRMRLAVTSHSSCQLLQF